jgi:pimeloyl-ACP methyl ester carboxylesterase
MTRTWSRRQLLRAAAAAGAGTGIAVAAPRPRRAPARFATDPAHFVFVHGAWHGAWCWYRVVALLEAAGQRVTALDLPSGGIDATPPASTTLQSLADRVIAFLDTVTEPVILVGHSAGGPVISTVAEARPQAIAKLVYLTAYLLTDGMPLLAAAAEDPETLITGHAIINPEGTLELEPAGRREALYGDCRAADVALAQSLLKPIGLRLLTDPVRIGTAFESVRRFYIACSRDRGITPAQQQRMYERLPCERVFTLKSDHSPFLSHPTALARVLAKIARA